MADLLHPDAELLELAAQRNHLVELRTPIREKASRLSALAEEQWKSEGNGASRSDPAGWEAYMELCRRVGLIDAEDAREAIDDQIFPLDHKIRAIPAQTVAGLKVKFDLLRDYLPTSYVDEGPRANQDLDVCLFNELSDEIGQLAIAAHADAKLIELGRQFEKAKAETRPLEKERSRLRLACDVTAQSMGIADYAENGAASAYKKLWRQSGYKAVSDAFAAKHSKAVRLMKAIHRARATTLEGFAVKAAAVAFDQSDFEVDDPVPTDVAERELYRLARDMAKAVKAGGRSNG
jgi:hypothetical protein